MAFRFDSGIRAQESDLVNQRHIDMMIRNQMQPTHMENSNNLVEEKKKDHYIFEDISHSSSNFTVEHSTGMRMPDQPIARLNFNLRMIKDHQIPQGAFYNFLDSQSQHQVQSEKEFKNSEYFRGLMAKAVIMNGYNSSMNDSDSSHGFQ